MDAKVVVLFRQGVAGWSEVYYWTGPDGDPLPIYSDIASLVDRRRNLLTATAYVQAVRVERLLSLRPSDDPQPVSLVSYWDQFEQQGRAGTFVTHPALCVISNSYPVAPPGWKVTFLHGCPPAYVEYSPQRAAFGVISDSGAAYFALYADLLRGADRDYPPRGQWCVLRSSLTAPDAVRQPITDIDTSGEPKWYWRLGVGEPDRVRANDLVTVGRVKGCGTAGVNGDWFVRAVDDGMVELYRSTFQEEEEEPELRDAYLRPHIYELLPIVKTYYRRTSSRDMGRRYHRYSWAPIVPGARGAVHPCGVAMDYLRCGYQIEMRTFRTVELPWLVVWFRVEDTVPLWLTETPFRSLNWHEPKRNIMVGEQRPWNPECHCDPPPWYRGAEPADFPALVSCGAPLAWRNGGISGTDPIVLIPPDLIPGCCLHPGMTATIRVGKAVRPPPYYYAGTGLAQEDIGGDMLDPSPLATYPQTWIMAVIIYREDQAWAPVPAGWTTHLEYHSGNSDPGSGWGLYIFSKILYAPDPCSIPNSPAPSWWAGIGIGSPLAWPVSVVGSWGFTGPGWYSTTTTIPTNVGVVTMGGGSEPAGAYACEEPLNVLFDQGFTDLTYPYDVGGRVLYSPLGNYHAQTLLLNACQQKGLHLTLPLWLPFQYGGQSYVPCSQIATI